ncbi:MAG: ATP-binding protein [Bacteroidales bacterium]
MGTISRNRHLEFDNVDACEMLAKTVKLAQYRIESQNISIQTDPANCPFIIYVSANRMEQVFLNIIINAIDSIIEKMQELPLLHGEIHVRLEGEKESSRIIFTDNGMGMDDQMMKKIFDPFFTTKKVGEGTGLGLSVSYQIVRDHGGEIRVWSDPGKGSTFTVSLPNPPEKGIDSA